MKHWLAAVFVCLLLVIVMFAKSHGAVLTATDIVAPLNVGSHSVAFDFGGPLSGIVQVQLTIDPCNALGN